MAIPFSENSNCRLEIRALLRLHRLWQDGKGESPEADAIRDDEEPWRLLSELERKRVRGLSEDLNSISEPPATELLKEMNPQAHAKLAKVCETRERGEWDDALELLRALATHAPPALISYLRGLIWLEAGEAEVALVFIEHATQLDPDNYSYHSLVLSTPTTTGQSLTASAT